MILLLNVICRCMPEEGEAENDFIVRKLNIICLICDLTDVLVLESPVDYGVSSEFCWRFHKDILRVQLKNILLKQLNIHVNRTPLRYYS